MANGNSPDWKLWLAIGGMLIGWAFNLGMWRFQMAAIDEDVTRHIEVTPYHPGVRALTDHNAARIALLEIAQARIDAKLEAILDAIEKNHR